MYKEKKVSALLLMGGVGNRFQSEVPKQFHRLSGKSLYLHTLETFQKIFYFDEIILVCHEEWISFVKKEVPSFIKVVPGKATRQESSFSGLLACDKKTDLVVIHDAIRPFVSQKIIEENIEKAALFHAVDTCISTTDTIVHSLDTNWIENIPVRKQYLRGQTPQSFSYDLIFKAHQKALEKNLTASDDCRLVLDLGHKVAIVKGDENNLKITTELDLLISQQILRKQPFFPKKSTVSLRKKTFAIVGGSGGIGSHVIELLLKEKALPISLSRSSLISLDLMKKETIQKAFQKIHQVYGPIDGLINTAGLLKIKSFDDLEWQEIDELIKVNLTGLIQCCKECILKKDGHIINVASSAYFKGRKNYGIYSASKAFVVNFTQSLAEEKENLRVNAIAPPKCNTFMRKSNFPKEDPKDLLHPSAVAKAIVSLLKEPHTTGSILNLNQNSI